MKLSKRERQLLQVACNTIRDRALDAYFEESNDRDRAELLGEAILYSGLSYKIGRKIR